MFESYLDRRAMIKSLGGICVRVRTGDLWGIFDNASGDALDLIETHDPTLLVNSLDFSALNIAKDETLDINGEQYRIKKVMPDGTGMTTLVLKR